MSAKPVAIAVASLRGALAPRVDAIIYDTQNEFAPDNPLGREVLELDARGGLKYRRQRQVVLAEVS